MFLWDLLHHQPLKNKNTTQIPLHKKGSRYNHRTIEHKLALYYVSYNLNTNAIIHEEFTCHLGPFLALLSNIVNHDGPPLYISSLGLLQHLLCFSLSFELNVGNAVKRERLLVWNKTNILPNKMLANCV